MRSDKTTQRAIRARLLARASAFAMRVALRRRGLASGLLAAGLIGTYASAQAQAQEVIDLANHAELEIQGAAPNERSGISVSGAGDVNGDGIDDLIIGAHGADTWAGATYVVFGNDQLQSLELIDLANNADLVIQGAQPNQQSGYSVSGAGDVNGDGIDDLIIGAPYAAVPDNQEYAGVSYVVFGRQSFPDSDIDLAEDADLTISGVRYEFSGISVSGAGDINGDGIDDLIIGGTASLGDPRAAGVSYVVFGRQSFPDSDIDLADDADLTMRGENRGDVARSVSGAGDINGDGIDDLIIGAKYADPNGLSGAGTSYVVFGRQSFPDSDIDLGDDADLTIWGAAPNDRSGASVSGAGDVNGDGMDDLIIGAEYAAPPGRNGAGTSYVVFGRQSFPDSDIDLGDDADLTIWGANGAEHSGASVSGAGDVNGDGIDDLIIGAPYAGYFIPIPRQGAGISYVLLGSDEFQSGEVIDLATAADLTIWGAEKYDTSGISVSGVGDVNDDGIDDLIIGARLADWEDRDDSGTSYVIFGEVVDPAAALVDLIADIEAAGLPHGLENSLTKKLENALKDLAKGDVAGAIEKIEAFISEVEAQRGKKIDDADADAWIAEAQAILDLLGAT